MSILVCDECGEEFCDFCDSSDDPRICSGCFDERADEDDADEDDEDDD